MAWDSQPSPPRPSLNFTSAPERCNSEARLIREMFLILLHFSCVIGRPAFSSEKSVRAVPLNSSKSFGPHTDISCKFMGEIIMIAQ